MNIGDKVILKQGSQTYPGEITAVHTNPVNRVITRATVRVKYMDLAGVLHETSTTVPLNALQRR